MSMLFQAAQRQPLLSIIGNHDATPMSQPQVSWPGYMNRNTPNTKITATIPHVEPKASKEEMLWSIECTMRNVRQYIGLEHYTESEKVLQYALWDEYVNRTPGLAITLNRLRNDEISIEQAVADTNAAIDLLNFLI